MAESSSPGLSAAQARHVFATFRHVDELLARALAPLDRTDEDDSLAAVRNDFDLGEAETVRAAVAAVREELEAGVRALHLHASSEPVSARWAAATAVRLALIALAELDARHLAAYGAIAETSSDEVARVRERLEKKLEALRRILDE